MQTLQGDGIAVGIDRASLIGSWVRVAVIGIGWGLTGLCRNWSLAGVKARSQIGGQGVVAEILCGFGGCQQVRRRLWRVHKLG